MKQCPFLLRLCQEVLLRAVRWFFFFRCPFLPEAESECRVCQPAPWMKQTATHSRTNREEWLLPPGGTNTIGPETFIHPCRRFALFTLPIMSFSFLGFPFLWIFTWSFFYPICLCFRLPPFCAFQWAASVSHFRSGRKGNSGIGRESKVKPPVFCGNLQPFG